MEVNKESLNDFLCFVDNLESEFRNKLNEEYLIFCKEIIEKLMYNPSVYFTVKDHLGFRFEKYNRILNIEIYEDRSLDIFDKYSNGISSVSSFYSMKKFTTERLNEIIKKFMERSEI